MGWAMVDGQVEVGLLSLEVGLLSLRPTGGAGVWCRGGAGKWLLRPLAPRGSGRREWPGSRPRPLLARKPDGRSTAGRHTLIDLFPDLLLGLLLDLSIDMLLASWWSAGEALTVANPSAAKNGRPTPVKAKDTPRKTDPAKGERARVRIHATAIPTAPTTSTAARENGDR